MHSPEFSSKTPAQRRAEKTGYISLAIIILITTSPGYLWIFTASGFSFSAASIAVFFVWAWNFYFLGRRRILTAAIILTRNLEDACSARQAEIDRFIIGLALNAGMSSPATLRINVNFDGEPFLEASLSGGCEKVVDLDFVQCCAVVDLLSGNGDIYRLAATRTSQLKVSWDSTLSSHARISSLLAVKDAIKSSISLRS